MRCGRAVRVPVDRLVGRRRCDSGSRPRCRPRAARVPALAAPAAARRSAPADTPCGRGREHRRRAARARRARSISRLRLEARRPGRRAARCGNAPATGSPGLAVRHHAGELEVRMRRRSGAAARRPRSRCRRARRPECAAPRRRLCAAHARRRRRARCASMTRSPSAARVADARCSAGTPICCSMISTPTWLSVDGPGHHARLDRRSARAAASRRPRPRPDRWPTAPRR